ncbi:MAG: hypothetical protein KIS87_11105 [Phycisphaeraceae bacterium]|nr:hypothetical protein [Phycisphaeraceae bacterium]
MRFHSEMRRRLVRAVERGESAASVVRPFGEVETGRGRTSTTTSWT